jgi:urease accessory protein
MNIDKLSMEQISALQLSDSFFPTGMYTTSNGLEALFYNRQKKLNSPKEFLEMIMAYLENQIGPTDCTALGNSYNSAQRQDPRTLIEIDRMIFSMKLIRDIREASARSGSQMIRCLVSFISNDEILNRFNDLIKTGEAIGMYPVAFAIACKALGISKNTAGLVMLYSFIVSMVGAALRLGMLQHYDGQRIIHELKPEIVKIVGNCIERPLTSMWQFAPGIDIIQMKHERMNSKMFIT